MSNEQGHRRVLSLKYSTMAEIPTAVTCLQFQIQVCFLVDRGSRLVVVNVTYITTTVIISVSQALALRSQSGGTCITRKVPKIESHLQTGCG